MTSGVGHRSGWYYGWNIVAVCILGQVAGNAMAINAFSLFLHSWSTEFHLPISRFLLGLAGCGIGSSLIAPLVGVWADKYPTRLLFGIGLAGMAAFCLGISAITQTWQYYVLYSVILPVSLCLCTSIPANAVLSRWFVRRLGLALGLSGFGLAIAGVIMPPLVAAVMPLLGWRGVWRVAGLVIGLLILPVVVFVLRDRPAAENGTYYLTKDGSAPPVSMHGAGGKSRLTLLDVFGRRNFWLLIIVYLPMLAAYGGCGQNIAPLAASRGLTTHEAGILLSLYSLSQMAVTLAGGMLSDKFGNRRPLAGLAFGTALGGVAVAYGHSFPMLALGIILAGFGGSFWPLLAAAAAAEFGAEGVGRAFGLLTFFLPLGVIAPFMVAKMQESTGNYGPALVILSAVTLLGGALVLLMREPRGGQDTPAARLSEKGQGALPPGPPLKASL